MQQQSLKPVAMASSRIVTPEHTSIGRAARPRVLYVCDDEYPRDARTEKVCSALTTHGFEVHLVARNRRWAPRSERLPEGIVHRMRSWRALGRKVDAALAVPAFFNPRWMSLLTSTSRSIRPHVLIVRDVPLCPTALHVGRRLGLPVVLDMAENCRAQLQSKCHGSRHTLLDYAVRNPAAVVAMQHYCVHRVDRILVAIEELGDRLAGGAGVPRDRIDVVSNTPPRARAEHPVRPLREPGTPLELVYVGACEASHGVGEILDAMAQLRGRASVRLTIVGDGRDLPILRAQAARLGLTSREVDFRGFIPDAQALSTVGRSHVGIVPHHAPEARNTTVSTSLFDYMAAGLAVVTSDAAPAARIVRTTGAGEVCRAGDAADLARAIQKLSDPQRCAAAGEAGRRAILERYHWEQDSAALARSVGLAARSRDIAVA